MLDEIEKAGGQGEILDFEIPAYDCSVVCKAKITAPFEKKLEEKLAVVSYGCYSL